MSIAKKELLGQRNQNPGSVIHLDVPDLMHLFLLNKFGPRNQLADPKKGLSIPRRILTDNDYMMISDLEAAGRIRPDIRIPSHLIAPGKNSGNLVVRATVDDDTVLSAFHDVDPITLRPILDFAQMNLSQLEAIDIFPNSSNRRLKGVALHFKPNSDRWWQQVSKYNWPIERGIMTVALPIGFEEFAARSDAILLLIKKIGDTSNGTIKNIRFYHDETGRVFMTLSAGSTTAERSSISDEISTINRPGKMTNFLKQLELRLRLRREDIVKTIIEELHLGTGEEVITHNPYVGFKLDIGLAYSGGVGLDGGLLPFGLSKGGLIIHKSNGEHLTPLGLPRIETGKKIPSFISKDKIRSLIADLNPEIILDDLVAGFHSK